MRELTFLAHSLSDTDRLGKALAVALPDRATVSLVGTLGAGKTRLVRAIAQASGIDPETVTSPTFVLCQPYRGTRSIWHLDAYRIGDADEFLELGVEEYFDSDGLTIVEWGDRVTECLPDSYLEIVIEVVGETSRRSLIRDIGGQYAAALATLKKTLDALCRGGTP